MLHQFEGESDIAGVTTLGQLVIEENMLYSEWDRLSMHICFTNAIVFLGITKKK